MNEELFTLLTEYRKTYPNTEEPTGHTFQFGEQGLIDILKAAKGRKIIFELNEAEAEFDDRPSVVVYE